MSPFPFAPRPGHAFRARFVVTLTVTVIAVAAALLGACGSGSGGASPSAAASPPADAPNELRVAYQPVASGDLIVKGEGWLEAALPGTKVTWVKFDASADVNDAIVAGDIDIGLVGSTSAAAGLSQPLDIAYSVPWIYDVIGAGEALVVKNDASIADFDGLVGKRVGTTVGSTAHLSLLAALELNGVDAADVTLVGLDASAIPAAWQAGDIDAAYVGDPALAELEKDGTVLVTSADLIEEGRPTAHLAVASAVFLKAHPQTMQTWLDLQNRAVKLYATDPQAAADAVGRQLDISGADALARMKDLVFLDASRQSDADYLGIPSAPGLLADVLQSTAEFLKVEGGVDSVPPLADFQDALANEFVARAGGK